MNKPITLIWFEEWGWIYRPIAPAGWILVIIAALFIIQLSGLAWLSYRSIGAAFFVLLPYLVSILTILYWVASKTARK